MIPSYERVKGLKMESPGRYKLTFDENRQQLTDKYGFRTPHGRHAYDRDMRKAAEERRVKERMQKVLEDWKVEKYKDHLNSGDSPAPPTQGAANQITPAYKAMMYGQQKNPMAKRKPTPVRGTKPRELNSTTYGTYPMSANEEWKRNAMAKKRSIGPRRGITKGPMRPPAATSRQGRTGQLDQNGNPLFYSNPY